MVTASMCAIDTLAWLAVITGWDDSSFLSYRAPPIGHAIGAPPANEERNDCFANKGVTAQRANVVVHGDLSQVRQAAHSSDAAIQACVQARMCPVASSGAQRRLCNGRARGTIGPAGGSVGGG